MPKLTHLGDLERAVMDCLWSTSEPQTVRKVHETLSLQRDLAYTTVMTVLQRLARKNLVSQIRDDRAHRYTPVRSRDELVARADGGSTGSGLGFWQPTCCVDAVRRTRRCGRGGRVASCARRIGSQTPPRHRIAIPSGGRPTP